jgi:hypothetical protein
VRNHSYVDPGGVQGLYAHVVEVQKAIDQRVAEGLPVVGRVVHVPFAGFRVVDEARIAGILVECPDEGFGGEVVFDIELLHGKIPFVRRSTTGRGLGTRPRNNTGRDGIVKPSEAGAPGMRRL